MTIRVTPLLVFGLLIVSLFPSCTIYGMDKAAEVEKFGPIIMEYASELQRTVSMLYQTMPESRHDIHLHEQDALQLLEEMQMKIVDFREAFSSGNSGKCCVLYNDMHTIQKGLEAVKQQLIRLCERSSAARLVHADGAVGAPAMPKGQISTLEASRMAREAHLSTPRLSGPRRFSIQFDHNRIPAAGLNGIPLSLQHLSGVQVLYYPSPNTPSRVPGTCGTRAIGNALAIRDAVLSGSLNPTTVFNNATAHDDLNSHDGTFTDESVNLALALRLEDFHCLAFVERYPRSHWIKNNPFSIIASTSYCERDQLGDHSTNLFTEDAFQAQIVQTIRNSKNIVVSFLCSVDLEKPSDHAVLVSIVKRERVVPTIIYMDCNNEPVLDQSKAAAFIHYLYLQCIA